MKVVVDTDVVISGFFGGVPGRVPEAWRDGSIHGGGRSRSSIVMRVLTIRRVAGEHVSVHPTPPRHVRDLLESVLKLPVIKHGVFSLRSVQRVRASSQT